VSRDDFKGRPDSACSESFEKKFAQNSFSFTYSYALNEKKSQNSYW
jgi:hypothetical protein